MTVYFARNVAQILHIRKVAIDSCEPPVRYPCAMPFSFPMMPIRYSHYSENINLIELARDEGDGKRTVRMLIHRIRNNYVFSVQIFKPDECRTCHDEFQRLLRYGNSRSKWWPTTFWLWGMKHQPSYEWVRVMPPVDFAFENAQPSVEQFIIPALNLLAT